MKTKNLPALYQAIKRLFYTVLTSGYGDSVELKQRSEIILLNIIVMVGIAILAPYGIFRMAQGVWLLGLIDFSVAVFLAALSVFHWVSRQIIIPRIGSITIVTFLFGYLAISTGHHNTGLLWSFCLPAVMVFILGRKSGNLVLLAYIIIVLCCFAMPIFPCYKNYSLDLKVTFLFWPYG